ncbi:MAG: hypothetical protein IPM32_03905 [Ignavibacteriae bacterium]|nr:hypothetical protein [Ignavibacteriota bacterium]
MRALRILPFLFLLLSCDKGLSPENADQKAGFGGTVTFIGNWNSAAKQTYVVAFKDPLLSISDFSIFNLKFVSDSIPFGSNNFNYSTNSENAVLSNIEFGDYSYVAVAQTIRDTLSLDRNDWIVAGIYTSNDDSAQPGILNIPQGTFIENVNILCDFNNPPPQPPSEIQNLLKSFFESKKSDE